MGNQSGKHQNPHKFRQRRHGSWRGVDTPFPPGKPYLPIDLDSAPDLITIRWDKPFKDGGAPISGYLIEHRRIGSPHWVKATPALVQATELTLGGLEPGWRYQFRIFAENVAGLSDPSELSEALTVTLQRAAITSPRFTQELKDTVALENEKVEFVVYFLGQPPPKICWFKDGFEIFSSRRTRIITESDRSVLTFYQSALCDEGEIKCSATNKAGHSSAKANLKLESPPSVRLPRQYEEGLLFEIGEVIRLKVSVAGLPTPMIYWSHDGETLANNERCVLENSEQTSMLRINEARRNDRGEYQVKAVNRLGQSVASFLVTITDKPSPPGKAKVVMTLGKSVTLQWNTPEDDGGCKIGNYIVEYFRLGWNVWLKAATSRQLTTMLGDLIEGSEYKFRVKAESPYGVSEPSEESEVVFIPDTKRGIMKPDARSRSQPREIDEILTPVASRRKNKQPRSFSSPRTEENLSDLEIGEESKVRVEPLPKVNPELSPKITDRKPVKLQTKLNKDIFDRASITRDFSYGSPEIRVKKVDMKPEDLQEDLVTYKPSKQLQDSIRSTKITIEKNKSPSPAKEVLKPPVIIRTLSDEEKSPTGTLTPRTNLDRNKFSRENSENLGGSSEYMLVLYPEEEHREFDGTGIDFSNSIAPPLSLSAPELGTEFPVLVNLRLSASSTELLHERALVRFYQEALAEEEDMKRRRDHDKSPIPKIHINSQEDEDIVGLERKHSLRKRLSAGGTVPNQLLWTQKRHSLRNSGDLTDVILEGKQHKNMTAEEKRLTMTNRQRSESEEREEEEFERVRKKMAENPAVCKKKICVVAEEVWDEDELEELNEEKDELISLSDSASSIDDRWNLGKRVVVRQVEDEDDTYHPSMRNVIAAKAQQEATLSPTVKSKYEVPFEILTKPVGLPDPNFVPKPILKKREAGDPTSSASDAEQHSNVPSSRSSSVTTDDILDVKPIILEEQEVEKPSEVKDINVVASIAGIIAVGPILAHPLLQKKVEQEQKVAIDHYGDIVKSYSQRSRTPSLTISSILDKYAKQGTDEVILASESEPEPELPMKVIEPPEKEKFKSLKKFDERIQLQSPINDNVNKSKPSEPTNLEGIETRASAFTRINTRLATREPRRPRMASPSPMRGSKPNPMLADKIPIMQPIVTKPEIKVVERRPERRSNSKARSGSRSRSITRSSKPPSRSNSSTQTAAVSISTGTGTETNFMRKPRMCEIMTQTSTNIDPYPKLQPKVPSIEEIHQKVLEETAQYTIRTTIDYMTDLSMFSVACWFFLFSNELYAIPVLGVLVFRQLKEALPSLVPKWIKRRLEKRREAAALKRRLLNDD